MSKWMLVKDMGVGRDCSMRDLGEVCGGDCALSYSSTPHVVLAVSDRKRGLSVVFATGLSGRSMSEVTECTIRDVVLWEELDVAHRVKKLAVSMQSGLYSKGVCCTCSLSNGVCAVCSTALVCGRGLWTVLEPCVASMELGCSAMADWQRKYAIENFMRQNQA
jgi:hypothetical protein